MARYSRDTNSFSVSINNVDAAGNANTAGNADIAGSVHVGVADFPKPNRFTEPNRFTIESLCFPQEHGASCNSQTGGETRDTERGLNADR
jgi:hypothetical protein